jgi:hypothetical protein
MGGAIESAIGPASKSLMSIVSQSAPSPGITHGCSLKIRTSNVVCSTSPSDLWVTPPEKGDERDGITIFACEKCDGPTTDILLENVSTSWSVDEGIGLWGDRLARVTIRN